MRIVFIDDVPWSYCIDSVYQAALGGSQSALCYLAEALARQGHEVVLVNHCAEPVLSRGVQCLPWRTQLPAAWLQSLDAVIVLNSAGAGRTFRPHLSPHTPLILWSQHASDQPAVQELRDSASRDAYDAFALVSEWQRWQYVQDCGIDATRIGVLPNAVSPAFENLFPDGAPILAQKARPPVLAYTSTPFRGLHMLLDVSPRSARPFRARS
jgi:hypothetical protein